MFLCALFKKNNQYHAPDSNEIRKKIFRDGDDLYMLEPIICICPSSIRSKI